MNKITYYLTSIKYILFFLIFFIPTISKAEGTSTISPNSNVITALSILPSQSRGSYLGCPDDNRIYFRVNDHTTENLFFGFNWRNYASSTSANPAISDVYMRIYDPAGNQVAQLNLPSSGNGYINSWSEANIGANVSGSHAGGYTPLSFNPTTNGEYYVNIYRSVDTGANQFAGTTWSFSPYWDLQVASSTGVRKNGRVHCNKWAFNAVHPTNFYSNHLQSAEPTVFAFSEDSCVVKVRFNQEFKPISFDLTVNSYGVINTNDYENDRISSNNASFPTLDNGYKLFVNYPDTLIYSQSNLPLNPTIESPALIGCSANYKIRYSIYEEGDVRMLFDFNGTTGYQVNSSDRIIELFNVSPGLNTYLWDGKDGLGNTISNNTQFKIVLSYLKGRFNIPVYDAEVNKYGLSVEALSPINNSNIKVYWNDTLLNSIGTLCDATLANSQNNLTNLGTKNIFVGAISPCHAWSGDGNFFQVIPAPSVGVNESSNFQCDDFGNVRTINSFGWAVDLKDSAIITLNCLQATGTIWNDKNGSANGTNSNIFSTGELGTSMNIPMYATLVDPVTGLVLQSVSVNSNGAFTFTSVPTNGIGMQVVIATTIGVVDNLPPTPSINPNWKNTSPLTRTFNSVTSNLIGLDFGVSIHNAINDQTTSLKNAIVTGNASTNDTIVSGSTYSIIGTPTKGTITITSAGNYTYTPNANAIGTDSVRYQVCTSSPMNICDTAKIYFAINSVNAVDNFDTTTINTPKTISVLGNDTDPQGNTISNPIIVVNPLHGTVSVNVNGTILYTPTTGYIGTDNFQYRITDNGAPVASDTALVNLFVFKPTHNAINDQTTSLKNAIVTGNASTNDTIVSGSTYSIIGTPTKGTITITSAGNYTYTPNANAIGTDSVRYQVCTSSPMNICDTAKIYFAINSVNAVDNFDTTTINTPKTISVLGNDTDQQGNTISNPIIVVNPLHGTVSVNVNGTILYTPTTGYIGTDNFQYRITDNGAPVASDTALVNLFVFKPTHNAINDQTTSLKNAVVTGNASTNDNIVSGSTYSIIGTPTKGTITITSIGNYTYTPNANAIGTDSVRYQVCTSSPMNICDTAKIYFAINSVNAVDNLDTTTINTPKTISVLGNDTDPQGNTISNPIIVVNPLHGTVSVNVNGTILYTPTTGYIGTDNFQYRITDNGAPIASDTALVNLFVFKPTFIANADFNNTIIGNIVSGNLSTNDIILPGTTYSKIGNSSNGNLILNSNGSYTYTPNANFEGKDIISYEITSPAPMSIKDTSIVSFRVLNENINAINSIVAQVDQVSTAKNNALQICVLCNDTDPQFDSILGPTIISNPINGSITLNSNGQITYSPNLNFVGTDYFTYSICDNNTNSKCDTTTVYIEVTNQTIAINQTFANDDSYYAISGVAVSGNASLNDTDPQNDNVLFSTVSMPSHGVLNLNSDGSFNYMPDSGYAGPDNFIYSKCDNGINNVCDTATIYFNMLKLNTALPVIWGNFNVLENNCIVNVNWNTLEEINVSKFNIERKLNNESFEIIGTVFAKGNNSASQTYNFVDRNATSGINQYRLNAVDLDGKSMISSTKSINLNCIKIGEVSLYPNPAHDNVYLALSATEETTFDVKIIDAIGKIVYTNSVEINNNKKVIDISTANLSNGIYSIILNNGAEKQVIKFSKN